MHQLIRVENFFLTKLLDDFLNIVSNIISSTDTQLEIINVSDIKLKLEEVMLKFDETSVYFYVDSNNSVPVNTNKYSYFTFDDYNKIKECYIALTKKNENVFAHKNISLLSEAIAILNDYYSFAINNGYLNDDFYLRKFGTRDFQGTYMLNNFNQNYIQH